ncbi:MAG: glycosyltransferase family 39 protein [Actinomycetia bacterium]|nr:glycosyltransferase family 39 protein [Actinomycetes bacterium]
MSHATFEPSLTHEGNSTEGNRSRFSLYLGLELLFAFGVAVSGLGRPSLWLDEAYSVDFTSGSWSDLFGVIAEREAMHGFYYVLLKGWSSVAGTSEIAVRLPSVVFFLAAVGAIAILGRLLFSDRVGLIAGVLLTVNPFLLVFAREARSYAMVTALVTIATVAFVHLVLSDRPDRPDLAVLLAYTIVGTFAVYTHAWAIFVLVVHAGTLFLVDDFRRMARWFVGSWAIMAALAAPLLYFLVFVSTDQVTWIPAVGPTAFVHHFKRHTGGWILMVVFLALIAIAFSRYAFGDRKDMSRWRIAMVAAWVVVPPVLTFLVSLAVPLFLSRYLIVALPGLVLLASVGVDALKPVWLGIGAIAVVVSLSMVKNAEAYTSSIEDWRGAVSFIMGESVSDDLIVFYSPDVSVPYRYYERRTAGGEVPAILIYDTSVLGDSDATATALVDMVETAGDRRVWVVLSHDLGGRGPTIEENLASFRPVVMRREFEGSIRVVLLETP